jgi:hypothetical protein
LSSSNFLSVLHILIISGRVPNIDITRTVLLRAQSHNEHSTVYGGAETTLSLGSGKIILPPEER